MPVFAAAGALRCGRGKNGRGDRGRLWLADAGFPLADDVCCGYLCSAKQKSLQNLRTSVNEPTGRVSNRIRAGFGNQNLRGSGDGETKDGRAQAGREEGG